MRIGLLLIALCAMLLAGCAKTSTMKMKVYSEATQDSVELSYSDVPIDSVCAEENRSKYPEDWTNGCDSYQTAITVMKVTLITLLTIPMVMIVACLPFMMAGGK